MDDVHPGIRARSHILEIICADDMIIALTNSGLCRAFDCQSHRPLGLLNSHREEIIRSTFHNRYDNSIITVSVSRGDPTNCLRCNVVSTTYIRNGTVKQNSFHILENEKLSYPGFVEFDDVNGKMVSYCAQSLKYRVWSLRDYGMIFEIEGRDIQEVKISSHGMLLVIYHRVRIPISTHANHGLTHSSWNMYEITVPMKVVDIETGEVLRSLVVRVGLSHELRHNATTSSNHEQHAVEDNDQSDLHPIEFVEILNDKLLLKQHGHRLRVFDVLRDDCGANVKKINNFDIPDAFIFLYNNNVSLSFLRQGPELWDKNGRRIISLDRKHLFDQCNTNGLYISKDQSTLVSIGHHSQASTIERDMPPYERRRAAVRVNCIHTGKILWEMESEDLATVCALWYNEQRSELYLGRGDGTIHIYSN